MRRELKTEEEQTLPVNRRRFVQGVAAGAALAMYESAGWPVYGEPAPYNPVTLTGQDFNLTVDSLPVNFTGRRALATAVNGTMPGPILRWREGDTVTLA